MEPLLDLLKVSLGALLGAGLVLLVEHRSGRGEGRRPRRWAGAALTAALAGGFLGLFGLPGLPFGEDSLRATERLLWMLPLGFLATLVSWRWALTPLALVAPALLLGAFADWSWQPDELLYLAGLAAGAWLLTQSGDLVLRRRSGIHGAVQLGLFSAAAAGAIAATGTLVIAQWAGALGTAWGLLVLLAWRRWDANRLDGASLMLFTGLFLLLAQRYSELPAWDAGLLAAALPLALFVEDLFESARTRTLVSWLTFLAVLGVVGLRIALAWESDPYGDYYG